ncbi:YbaB/EbfC family nucleoid-associated protein [Tessaracoccus flavescens]|uniref:YbaB/EbfC family DNA-binding protein n=1 Tax=Tessaracoccus flavescens TaxID=399497 RepID=A0A1Q2CZL1_9ACTN|nr:YbaB/EbfC family nucleoid-associated protein [Tessaracoccus flavescens]AQP51547.1 hypothetical protein BW733_12715 [Tessaracoccus flavescens]
MNELEDILSRLGAELEKPLPAVEVPTVEAEGTSEDQMVRVSVTGGQVSGIVIDPRSMRKSSVELADDLMQAMNAGLKAHADALMVAMQAQAPDPTSLSTELDAVADEATKTLSDYLDLMTQMMESTAAKEG